MLGFSLAVLLAQNHEVKAITPIETKAQKREQFINPIQDNEIERFFQEDRERNRTLWNMQIELDLYTTE